MNRIQDNLRKTMIFLFFYSEEKDYNDNDDTYFNFLIISFKKPKWK